MNDNTLDYMVKLTENMHQNCDEKLEWLIKILADRAATIPVVYEQDPQLLELALQQVKDTITNIEKKLIEQKYSDQLLKGLNQLKEH